MIKKIFCGIAIIAGLSACNDDYTDWKSPQSNAANEAAEKFVLNIEPKVTAPIDFATVTATEIQLFTTNLEAGQTEEFTVTFTSDESDKTATLTTGTDGVVATADLADAVSTIYGRAPQERTLNVTVTADVNISTADGIITAQKTGAPFILKATPDAPHISANYYIVGGTLDWATSATTKEQKFSHSGQDVYNDPVFTITIPAAQGADTWFAIGDDEACDAIANNGDYSKLLGTTAGNGNNGETGSLKVRTELGDDGSFCVAAGAKSIRVELNMMEYTYKVTAIYPSYTYYVVGAIQGWSGTDKSCMFYSHGNDVYSYTTQWGGAWDLKIWDGDNFGNWDVAWGTATDGDGSESGSLINSGAQSFQSPAPGYYTLTVDMSTSTYSWTPVTPAADYTSVSLIGDFNGWGGDIDLSQIAGAPHNWYIRANIPTNGGLKFRADHDWGVSWGTDDPTEIGSAYSLAPGTGNINVPAGTYDFYLNDITGRWNIVAVE